MGERLQLALVNLRLKATVSSDLWAQTKVCYSLAAGLKAKVGYSVAARLKQRCG